MKSAGKLGNSELVGIIKEVAPCSTAKTDEELGVSEFENNYFPYPLYLNEDYGMYKYLGNRKITGLAFSWNPFKLYSGFKEIGERIKAKKLEGNYKGEGLTLGGILVVKKGEVVYKYAEETGSEIPTEEIARAVRGD
jgi:hypothetical protein